MSRFVPVVLLFLGYLLVYAAAAHSGRFATAPWRGVFEDAYDDPGGSP